jgi:hypothetical protein
MLLAVSDSAVGGLRRDDTGVPATGVLEGSRREEVGAESGALSGAVGLSADDMGLPFVRIFGGLVAAR